jgi:hypothetical protein
MERWFDLHLYFARWGSRRLMIRWPARMIDRLRLADFIREVDGATLRQAGANLIPDVSRDELESDECGEDGTGFLAALTPLRADVLAGDFRLFLSVVADGGRGGRLRSGRARADARHRAAHRVAASVRVVLRHRSRPRRCAAESSAGLAEISSVAALQTIAEMTDGEKNAFLSACSTAIRSSDPNSD